MIYCHDNTHRYRQALRPRGSRPSGPDQNHTGFPVQPATTRYNPQKPATTRYNPLQPTTTQYTPLQTHHKLLQTATNRYKHTANRYKPLQPAACSTVLTNGQFLSFWGGGGEGSGLGLPPIFRPLVFL